LSTVLVNANLEIKVRQKNDLKTKNEIYREKRGYCSSAVPACELPLCMPTFCTFLNTKL